MQPAVESHAHRFWGATDSVDAHHMKTARILTPDNSCHTKACSASSHSVAAMRKRDLALEATETALSEQNEQSMNIDAELRVRTRG